MDLNSNCIHCILLRDGVVMHVHVLLLYERVSYVPELATRAYNGFLGILLIIATLLPAMMR